MKNYFFFLISVLLVTSFNSFSQRKRSIGGSGSFGQSTAINDTINKRNEINVVLSGKTKYTDYKIISHQKDTTYIDTTLSLKKEYKFNYLRKDNFELLEFHNQGQTFNNLGYSFNNLTIFPDIGYTAKQFSYLNIEDVRYFEVPTPTTEILYRTGLQQGQVLDALFTLNFSKRLNVSLAYKGIRSLGSYRRSLASNGNFRGTFTYRTKQNQYAIRGHFTSQNFMSQENGGITDNMVSNFINDESNYKTRSRLDVNLDDAENIFNASRIYIEHDYKLISSKDSISKNDFSNLKIGHILTSENKDYNFSQANITHDFFGDSNPTNQKNTSNNSKLSNNQLFLEFNSKYVLGKFRVKTNYTKINYRYDSILNTNISTSKHKISDDNISFGADWKAQIKNFQLRADANLSPGNSILSGNHFKGEATYKKDSVFKLKGSLLINSKSPNFNTLLHQNGYDNYNWDNSNFSNINTRDLGFLLDSKWLNASLNLTNIDNFTYFNEDNLPEQFDDQIIYLKAKVSKEIKYKKFALDNTIMYQNVSNGSSVFRVPEFVTRNTLYYSDYWFKGKPMQVNIGATFKYFTKYMANAYNPLLAEFKLQNTTEIGFPTVDVFFNAQIRRTRIFFKIDNVTSNFSAKNYFSAPNYPYRDFTIRFGLVWNWFI